MLGLRSHVRRGVLGSQPGAHAQPRMPASASASVCGSRIAASASQGATGALNLAALTACAVSPFMSACFPSRALPLRLPMPSSASSSALVRSQAAGCSSFMRAMATKAGGGSDEASNQSAASSASVRVPTSASPRSASAAVLERARVAAVARAARDKAQRRERRIRRKEAARRNETFEDEDEEDGSSASASQKKTASSSKDVTDPKVLIVGWQFPLYFDPRFEPPPLNAFTKDPAFTFYLFDANKVGAAGAEGGGEGSAPSTSGGGGGGAGGGQMKLGSLQVALTPHALALWHQRYAHWISPSVARNRTVVQQRAEYVAAGHPTRFSAPNEQAFESFVRSEAFQRWLAKAQQAAEPALPYNPALEPTNMFPLERPSEGSNPENYHPSFEPLTPQLWEEYNITARDSEEYRAWFDSWLRANPQVARQREVYQKLLHKYAAPIWRRRMAAETDRILSNEVARQQLYAQWQAQSDRETMDQALHPEKYIQQKLQRLMDIRHNLGPEPKVPPSMWLKADIDREARNNLMAKQDQLDELHDVQEQIEALQRELKRFQSMSVHEREAYKAHKLANPTRDYKWFHAALTPDEIAAMHERSDPTARGALPDPELEAGAAKVADPAMQAASAAWGRVHRAVARAALTGKQEARRRVKEALAAGSLKPTPEDVRQAESEALADREAALALAREMHTAIRRARWTERYEEVERLEQLADSVDDEDDEIDLVDEVQEIVERKRENERMRRLVARMDKDSKDNLLQFDPSLESDNVPLWFQPYFDQFDKPSLDDAHQQQQRQMEKAADAAQASEQLAADKETAKLRSDEDLDAAPAFSAAATSSSEAFSATASSTSAEDSGSSSTTTTTLASGARVSLVPYGLVLPNADHITEDLIESIGDTHDDDERLWEMIEAIEHDDDRDMKALLAKPKSALHMAWEQAHTEWKMLREDQKIENAQRYVATVTQDASSPPASASASATTQPTTQQMIDQYTLERNMSWEDFLQRYELAGFTVRSDLVVQLPALYSTSKLNDPVLYERMWKLLPRIRQSMDTRAKMVTYRREVARTEGDLVAAATQEAPLAQLTARARLIEATVESKRRQAMLSILTPEQQSARTAHDAQVEQWARLSEAEQLKEATAAVDASLAAEAAQLEQRRAAWKAGKAAQVSLAQEQAALLLESANRAAGTASDEPGMGAAEMDRLRVTAKAGEGPEPQQTESAEALQARREELIQQHVNKRSMDYLATHRETLERLLVLTSSSSSSSSGSAALDTTSYAAPGSVPGFLSARAPPPSIQVLHDLLADTRTLEEHGMGLAVLYTRERLEQLTDLNLVRLVDQVAEEESRLTQYDWRTMKPWNPAQSKAHEDDVEELGEVQFHEQKVKRGQQLEALKHLTGEAPPKSELAHSLHAAEEPAPPLKPLSMTLDLAAVPIGSVRVSDLPPAHHAFIATEGMNAYVRLVHEHFLIQQLQHSAQSQDQQIAKLIVQLVKEGRLRTDVMDQALLESEVPLIRQLVNLFTDLDSQSERQIIIDAAFDQPMYPELDAPFRKTEAEVLHSLTHDLALETAQQELLRANQLTVADLAWRQAVEVELAIDEANRPDPRLMAPTNVHLKIMEEADDVAKLQNLSYLEPWLADQTIPNPYVKPAQVVETEAGHRAYLITDESQLTQPHRTDISLPFGLRSAGSLAGPRVLHHFEIRRRSEDDIAKEVSAIHLTLGNIDQQTHDKPHGRVRHILEQIRQYRIKKMEPSKQAVAELEAQIKKESGVTSTSSTATTTTTTTTDAASTTVSAEVVSGPVHTTTSLLAMSPRDAAKNARDSRAVAANAFRGRMLDAQDHVEVELGPLDIDEDTLNEIIMRNVDEYEILGFDRMGRLLTNQQIDQTPDAQLNKALQRIGYIENEYVDPALWVTRATTDGAFGPHNRSAMIDAYNAYLRPSEAMRRIRQASSYYDPVTNRNISEWTSEGTGMTDVDTLDQYVLNESIVDTRLLESLDVHEIATEEELKIWNSYMTEEGVLEWIASGGVARYAASFPPPTYGAMKIVSADVLEGTLDDLPAAAQEFKTIEDYDEHVMGAATEKLEQQFMDLKKIQWNPEMFVNLFTPDGSGELSKEGKAYLKRRLAAMEDPARRSALLKSMAQWKSIVQSDTGNSATGLFIEGWSDHPLAMDAKNQRALARGDKAHIPAAAMLKAPVARLPLTPEEEALRAQGQWRDERDVAAEQARAQAKEAEKKRQQQARDAEEEDEAEEEGEETLAKINELDPHDDAQVGEASVDYGQREILAKLAEEEAAEEAGLEAKIGALAAEEASLTPEQEAAAAAEAAKLPKARLVDPNFDEDEDELYQLLEDKRDEAMTELVEGPLTHAEGLDAFLEGADPDLQLALLEAAENPTAAAAADAAAGAADAAALAAKQETDVLDAVFQEQLVEQEESEEEVLVIEDAAGSKDADQENLDDNEDEQDEDEDEDAEGEEGEEGGEEGTSAAKKKKDKLKQQQSTNAVDKPHPLLEQWSRPSTLRHTKELPHMDPDRYNEVQSILHLKHKLLKLISTQFPAGGITLKLNQPQIFYPERKFRQHYTATDLELRNAVGFQTSGMQLFQVMFLMRKYRNASLMSDYIAREIGVARSHSGLIRTIENMIKCMESIPGLDTGIRIKISGRINGAAMASHYIINSGNIPLQTIHSNIDYSLSHAFARIGVFGVKVWLFQRKLDRSELVHRNINARGRKKTTF